MLLPSLYLGLKIIELLNGSSSLIWGICKIKGGVVVFPRSKGWFSCGLVEGYMEGRHSNK